MGGLRALKTDPSGPSAQSRSDPDPPCPCKQTATPFLSKAGLVQSLLKYVDCIACINKSFLYNVCEPHKILTSLFVLETCPIFDDDVEGRRTEVGETSALDLHSMYLW